MGGSVTRSEGRALIGMNPAASAGAVARAACGAIRPLSAHAARIPLAAITPVTRFVALSRLTRSIPLAAITPVARLRALTRSTAPLAAITALALAAPPPDLSAQDVEVAVEVVAPGVISTEANQTFPAEDPVTGDLWFSTYEGSFAAQTLMVARRRGDRWAAPEVAPFSGRWGDRAPRFSPDGSTLYFTSNRPRNVDGEPADMNLWRVPREAGGWGAPELLPDPYNSPANDIHAAATPDALWLASDRPGGAGRSDLYRVARDGSVSGAGPVLNTELSQPDLWVSADGSVMILAITDHPDGLGGDDLYISHFDGQAWSAPVNLGAPINSDEYEYGPTLSRDGQYLLFTSHRSGSADVYRVRLDAVAGVRP